MPTDIPALIERLNRKCDLASVGDRCELAFPDKHSTCGPVEWCAACDAAAALAEQAAELKDAWNMADAQGEKLDALLASKDWPHSPNTCACSYDKPDAVCMVHSPQVTALRRQLAEAREVVEALVNKLDEVAPAITAAFLLQQIHTKVYDGPTYEAELSRARQWLASTEKS